MAGPRATHDNRRAYVGQYNLKSAAYPDQGQDEYVDEFVQESQGRMAKWLQ